MVVPTASPRRLHRRRREGDFRDPGRAPYRRSRPRIEIAEAASPGKVPAKVWTAAASRKALDLLNALPHGVLAMSNDIPGLVETSLNVATAAGTDDSLAILISLRSSVASAMRTTKRALRAIAELAGADVQEHDGYPAWKPDPTSPLLARFQQVHERLNGKHAELRAVHAGLECGVLGEKFPGMEMISFGPVIQGAHSPDEAVEVASVERFWGLLREVLGALAE